MSEIMKSRLMTDSQKRDLEAELAEQFALRNPNWRSEEMSEQQNALRSLRGQYYALKGIPDGSEAALGIDLTGILTRLLDGLINQCFPGASSEAVAEVMVDPKPAQEKLMKKRCQREANKEIRKPADRNPTGERLTAKQRNVLREELAEDLFTTLASTAQTEGVDGCKRLVDEMRAA